MAVWQMAPGFGSSTCHRLLKSIGSLWQNSGVAVLVDIAGNRWDLLGREPGRGDPPLRFAVHSARCNDEPQQVTSDRRLDENE